MLIIMNSFDDFYLIFIQLFSISAANYQHAHEESEQVGELTQNPESSPVLSCELPLLKLSGSAEALLLCSKC